LPLPAGARSQLGVRAGGRYFSRRVMVRILPLGGRLVSSGSDYTGAVTAGRESVSRVRVAITVCVLHRTTTLERC